MGEKERKGMDGWMDGTRNEAIKCGKAISYF